MTVAMQRAGSTSSQVMATKGAQAVEKKIDDFGYSKFDRLDISDSEDEREDDDEFGGTHHDGAYMNPGYPHGNTSSFDGEAYYDDDDDDDDAYDDDSEDEYDAYAVEEDFDDDEESDEDDNGMTARRSGSTTSGSNGGKSNGSGRDETANIGNGPREDATADAARTGGRASSFNFSQAFGLAPGPTTRRSKTSSTSLTAANSAPATEITSSSDDAGGEEDGRGGEAGPDDGGARIVARSRVVIHPSDSKSGLNPLIYEQDPTTFEPKANPATGVVEVWGTANGWDAGMAKFMRLLEIQALYTKNSRGGWKALGTPEEQWVHAMKVRKTKALWDEKPQCFTNFERDYVMRVYLVRWPRVGEYARYHELSPSVWRRVVVSGGVTLRYLHDRVLGPAMGWSRNYNRYVYTDFRDGAVFGPRERQGIDRMQIRTHFIDTIHDDTVALAQVLRGVGDQMMYTYDLGDQWMHILELEEIKRRPPESEGTDSDGGESKSRCHVLDGAMACPPEDSSGLQGKGCDCYQEEVLDREDPLPPSLLNEIVTAVNVGGTTFDPYAFDLAEANRRVEEAVGDEEGDDEEEEEELEEEEAPTCDAAHLDGIIHEEAADNDAKDRTAATPLLPTHGFACARCGSLRNLKACARCRMVFYCSRECQNTAWKEGHKLECKRLAQQHGSLVTHQPCGKVE